MQVAGNAQRTVPDARGKKSRANVGAGARAVEVG
jgi:hypothetical protein